MLYTHCLAIWSMHFTVKIIQPAAGCNQKYCALEEFIHVAGGVGANISMYEGGVYAHISSRVGGGCKYVHVRGVDAHISRRGVVVNIF
jgi:hypothetical protein